MTTTASITNRWDTTNIEEGSIKHLVENTSELGTPAICVKRWGNLEWIPFNELSAGLWMRYRDTISTTDIYKPPIEPVEKKECDNALITSLLETLSVEQRKQWITKNPKYKDKICMDCGCFNPTKKKCIHHDCPGMCANCFDKKNKTGFTKCACCGQKQEITCPCCQEDFTPENMVKSEQCDHRICWACFGRSVKTSRPLGHCPMCRGVFCEKLIDIVENDFDDMPELIDVSSDEDDDDDDYIEGDQWRFDFTDQLSLSDEDFQVFLNQVMEDSRNGSLAQAIRDGNVRVTRGPLHV